MAGLFTRAYRRARKYAATGTARRGAVDATWLSAVHGSAFAEWLRTAPWAWPVVEALHIAGFALLFGSIAVVDLRVLGFGVRLDARALGRFVLPATRAGFALALATGVPMAVAQATELWFNRAFRLKLLLLAIALCNVLLFHARRGLDRRDALARAQAALSLACWFLIIVAGRGIAYV
jgi:hypothetical protein